MNDTGMSGKALFSVLRKKVQDLNIPVMTQSAVRRLITNAKTGAVLGAEVWHLPPNSAAALQHQKWMRRAEAVHNFEPAWADSLRAMALALEFNDATPRNGRSHQGRVRADVFT